MKQKSIVVSVHARKLHDKIATVGGAKAEALAYKWFQHTAAMEPCPVCVAIEIALRKARG